MHNVRVWKLQSQSIVPLLLWVIHPRWSLGSVPTYALWYLADLSVTLMVPVALFVLRHSEFSAAGQKCLISMKRQWNSSRFLPEYLIRCLWLHGPVDLLEAQSSGICCSFSSCSREGKRLIRALPWLLFPGKHLLCLSCWESTWRSIMAGNPLENHFLLENR